MCNILVHFILNLTPPWLQVKVTKYFDFVNLYVWRVLLLLRNYLTDFSNDDANQLREQCRWAMYTSFWPWPLHDCRSRSQKLGFCEFRCLTDSSLCSLLLRNYSTEFSNADANLPREQCRFATYTSFWPSPLHDCRSRSWNTSILWI